MILDKRTRRDAVKLLIFILVTSLSTGVLVILIGNLSFESKRNYRALFSDATGVAKGDDIRVAGVKVGSVKAIKIVNRESALIEFTVADSTSVTKASQATIRYRNLIGQRYISLNQGVGDNTRLREDSTLPLTQTSPALDLTILFNGFKPLFAALSPTDINKLSFELISVFQGQGGNLQGLLQSTASVTQTLADRDQVIGDLITNLNVVLETLSSRDEELSDLIFSLRDFLAGLVQDKDAILGSLDSISALATQTADLTAGIRPPLVQDIKGLRQVAGNLADERAEIDRTLQVLPIKLKKIGRTATYGSFFNFYLCEFRGRVKLPTGQFLTVPYDTGGDRCSLP